MAAVATQQPEHFRSTSPKPFVFVLMPFAKDFDDVYRFGIKGACEDAGAYGERVDEQLYTEGILDRIFNQIARADVLVADMTGRNPNVFYEVGYAHALGKIVILLTKSAEDIPFDLKHRQHIVYEGITGLRPRLAASISFALKEAAQRKRVTAADALSVRLQQVVPAVHSAPPSSVRLSLNEVIDLPKQYSGIWAMPSFVQFRFAIENESTSPIGPFARLCFLCPPGAEAKDLHNNDSFSTTGREIIVNETKLVEYVIPETLAELPPLACDRLEFGVRIPDSIYRGLFALRIFLREGMLQYTFSNALSDRPPR
jgi:hypothetical protein